MLCGSRIRIWNLANCMEKQNITNHLLMKNWKLRVWCCLFHFFHVMCKILNLIMWTTKHLAQASCTELTLLTSLLRYADLVVWKNQQFKSLLPHLWLPSQQRRTCYALSSGILKGRQTGKPCIKYTLGHSQR